MARVIEYKARPPLIPFHERTQKRAVLVTHRRLGKTRGILEDIRMAMLSTTRHRARYSYVAPTVKQAKYVAWPYIEDLFAAQVPGCVLNRSELTATFPFNNAQLRLFGVENAEGMRGGYNDGIACDEYGDFPSEVWPYILRPTLLDRDGWAVFTGTPKGRTALWEVWQRAKANPERWFALMVRASESGIVDEATLEEIRDEIGETAFMQEFECSFDVPIEGSYYGKLLQDAEAEGRLGIELEPEPGLPLFTAWDLGVDDRTAIWLFQIVPGGVLILDYHEGRGKGVGEYATWLRDQWPAAAIDYVPHDAKVKEFGSGKTRVEAMREHGLNPKLVPFQTIADGIQAVRKLLPRARFSLNTARGIDRLAKYVAGPRGPVHDEEGNSDAADAFRYLALAYRDYSAPPAEPEPTNLLTPDVNAYTIGPPVEPDPDDTWGI